MAAVYSTQFFAGTVSNAQQELYVCPSGYVAVLRDVQLYNNTAGAIDAFIELWTGAGQLATVAFRGIAAQESPAPWNGRAVFTAGQSLQAGQTGASLRVWASGYLLSAP